MKLFTYPWDEFLAKLEIPERVFQFLEKAKGLAKGSGFFLYFAGGPVRDVLLGRKVKDLDLVLEGSWEDLLTDLFQETPARLVFKSQFLTYKVDFGEGFTLDLVTARKEVYTAPASLPQVTPGTYMDDVLRRDFTINSLIYGLTPPHEEKIVDLLGGWEDLREGLLKPIHLKSFIEDPTRAFRGVRYKVRFSFDFSKEFFLALSEGEKSGSFQLLSPSRLSQELKLFVTKEPFANLPSLCEELQRIGLLRMAGLRERKISRQDFSLLGRAKEELPPKELEKFFLLFLVELEEKTLRRLNFSEEEIKKLLQHYQKFMKKNFLSNSDILEKVEYLERIPLYFLFRIWLEEPGEELVKEFLDKWRFIKPALKGRDLMALGVVEGKRIGEIFREIRRAKLEGKLHTLEDEKSFAKNLIFHQT